MAEQDVIFAIQAINNAAGPVGQAASSLDRLGNQLNKTTKETRAAKDETSKLEKGLGDLKSAAAGAIAAFGLQGVLNFTGEMVQLGASVESATMALNALSGNRAQEYIAAMSDATRGTISDMEAAQIASKLLGMQIVDTADQAGEFTRVAAILGAQFRGLGAREAADEFAIMLSNMSTLRLDTFGISSAAVRTEMERLKETIPGITNEMAFYQATMSQATPLANQLGGALTNQQSSIQRLNAHWENAKAAVGTFLADGLLPLIDVMAALAADSKILVWGGEVVNVFTLMQGNIAAVTDTITQLIQRDLSLGGALDYMTRRAELNAYAMGAVTTSHTTAAEAAENEAEVMRMIARDGTAATEVIDEHIMSQEEVARAQEEAARAARQLEAALRDQLRTQQSLASVAGDVDGQIGNLGVTVLRTTGANADMGEATAMLNDQIAQTSADLHEAQVAAMAMGDDGTGPLGAKVQELSGYLGHLQNRLNDVRGAAGGTTSAMTIQALTQEELLQVGESYMDFLRGTGNDVLMAGAAYDNLRLKYGLATEQQVAMEAGMQTLSEMISAGTVSVENAAIAYERLVTGQIASADASAREVEMLTQKAALQAQYGEDLVAQAELAAQAYGIDPYAQQADSAALLAENAASAADPVGAVAEQSERINEAVSGVMANAAPAFTALAESAPNALPPIMTLADRMSSMRNNLGVMGGLAESAFEAMNEAASSVVAEGAPLARANTLVAQMRAAWAYLLANPTLSLNVYLSQIGSVQGASTGPTIAGAGGGVFMTSGPTHLTVGDNPGGQELVTVTPISGTGTTRVNGQAVHMAGGGSLLAGGMGGTTTNYITVYAQSFDDFTREMKRRGLAFAEVA
jgi:hypothetical protein